MPRNIQYTLVQIPKKKENTATVQHVHTSYMYTCEYVSGKPTDSSPRNRFKTSPSSFSSAPLSTYLTYPVYLKVYIHTCYLHGSSFLLHVLKKAKRLKESFSESASSVCYLPPRKTYLIKRDVDYLYIHASYIYDLVPYPLYRSSTS